MGNLTAKESGEMVNFISPNVSNVTSFKVHFSPRQEGSGDPSPENVREITGWNGVEGYISNVAQLYSSTSNTLTTAIDWTEDVGTVYGGYVDLISGELVQEYFKYSFTGDEDIFINTSYVKTPFQFNINTNDLTMPFGNNPNVKPYCNILNTETSKYHYISDNTAVINSIASYSQVLFRGDIFGDTAETAKAKLKELYENGTPLTIVGTIRDTVIDNFKYQLTPQQLSTLKGQNNFWSNADYVEIEYELTETFDIQKAKRKIILNQPHVESASGDIVTFDTDMKGKLKECKVYFSPVQEGEGDPSPDNVREITGWNGVEVTQTNQNLIRTDDPNNPTLNYYARSSYNYVVYSEEEQAFTERDTIEHVGGGINEANHARINATKNDQARLFIAPKDGIYTFTCDYKNVGTNYGLRFYKIINGVSTRLGDIHGDADGLWHTRSFTVELNKGDSFRIYLYSNIYWKNFRVIKGDGTDYTENVTNDYSISWTDEAGTIYGGYVDLVSGELIVEYNTVRLEELNWNITNNNSRIKTNDLSGNIAPPQSYSKQVDIIGEQVQPASYNMNLSNYPNAIACSSSGELVKYYNGEMPNGLMVYKLAEPIHYQLTPQQILTLKGINNIYSNTNGQTEIKYWKH